MHDLIKKLEAAKEGSNELSMEIHRIVTGNTARWLAYTTSIDVALTLGRDIDEQADILEAIYNEFGPNGGTLSNAIICGCLKALRARMTAVQNGEG